MRYLFCFLLVAIISACGTPSFVEKGKPLDYLALETGDTLYGKVEYFKEEMVFSEFYDKIRVTDTQGKRRKFKRKNVAAFSVDGRHYESFRLRERTSYLKNGNLVENKYFIEPDGVQYFLERRTTGKLLLYRLEWIDRENNSLTYAPIIKKADDNYFLRPSYGILGIAKKTLSNYLSDCPEVQEKITNKEFKYVFEVVDFYNENCEDE